MNQPRGSRHKELLPLFVSRIRFIKDIVPDAEGLTSRVTKPFASGRKRKKKQGSFRNGPCSVVVKVCINSKLVTVMCLFEMNITQGW